MTSGSRSSTLNKELCLNPTALKKTLKKINEEIYQANLGTATDTATAIGGQPLINNTSRKQPSSGLNTETINARIEKTEQYEIFKRKAIALNEQYEKELGLSNVVELVKMENGSYKIQWNVGTLNIIIARFLKCMSPSVTEGGTKTRKKNTKPKV